MPGNEHVFHRVSLAKKAGDFLPVTGKARPGDGGNVAAVWKILPDQSVGIGIIWIEAEIKMLPHLTPPSVALHL